LKRAKIASVVEDALLRSDGVTFRLHAWVIMPNHAHLLYSPVEGFPLKQVMKTLKGSSSYQANRILGRTGSFWMADYHDRFIRDQVHFDRAVRYIERNPVKAGLCKAEHEWRWSSAWWKHKAAEAKAEDTR
jgi:REP element-mobilizing transposase RayT